MSRGPGKLQSQLLASATESDGYVQSALIERLFGYHDTSVRRALRALEARGLVELVPESGPGRKLYKITEAGRAAETKRERT
jgi:DNA-binding PadR family transcriptional regulator